MHKNHQVVVMMQCGKMLEFVVTCYEDYEALIREASTVWVKWISIGPTATVRKRDIVGIFYNRGNSYKGEASVGRSEAGQASVDDEL